MKAATLGIGSRLVGEGQPCLVVAHVGTSHEGNADVALRLIEAAFQAGADAIAFPVFRASELVARRHPERQELEAAELKPREWQQVLEAAKASGLLVVAEAFDRASRDLAAEAGVDAFQTHPTDLDHPELVRALATAGRPLLLGAGAGEDALVRAALEPARRERRAAGRPATAPAAPEELRLADLAARRERYRVPVGLFDATDGASAFALVAPALAAAHGADLVEKRLTLDRSRKGRDAAAALAPEEFYRMVELLRQAERARGDAFGQEAGGAPTRPARGRSIVAASLIGRGDVLTAERLLLQAHRRALRARARARRGAPHHRPPRGAPDPGRRDDQGGHARMKALITGGAGFVGSHLCEALLERGDEVHVVDNLSTGCDRQRRAPEAEPALPLHDRQRAQRAGAGRARRPRGRGLPPGRRRGRAADRREPGQHDRDQRPRHRDGAEARQQEAQEGAAHLHLRGLRQGQRRALPRGRRPRDGPDLQGPLELRLQQGDRRVPGARLPQGEAAAGGGGAPLQHRRPAPDRPLRDGDPELRQAGPARQPDHGVRRRHADALLHLRERRGRAADRAAPRTTARSARCSTSATTARRSRSSSSRGA